MTTLKIAASSGVIMAAALAGCSSSSHDGAQRADAPGITEYRPASTDYMPNYMTSSSAGQVMTTPQGLTVYTFDKDRLGGSSCYGDCARLWPPVLASADAQPYGRMSLASRDDGQQQWAYDGKPLYTYAEDAMHGDVKGENFGSLWHVVR
jgi:predicted lipoprotein with Yx(FWY)xxD motif